MEGANDTLQEQRYRGLRDLTSWVASFGENRDNGVERYRFLFTYAQGRSRKLVRFKLDPSRRQTDPKVAN